MSLFLLHKNTTNYDAGIHKDFGGMDHGDDQSAMLKARNKRLSQIVQDGFFRDLEFQSTYSLVKLRLSKIMLLELVC